MIEYYCISIMQCGAETKPLYFCETLEQATRIKETLEKEAEYYKVSPAPHLDCFKFEQDITIEDIFTIDPIRQYPKTLYLLKLVVYPFSSGIPPEDTVLNLDLYHSYEEAEKARSSTDVDKITMFYFGRKEMEHEFFIEELNTYT